MIARLALFAGHELRLVMQLDEHAPFAHGCLMNVPVITWTSLEPGQLKAMRISAAITARILLAIAVALYLVLSAKAETPFGVTTAPATLLLLYYTFVSPRRRFRRWGYAKTEDELHVAHGVLVHTETSVA